MAVRKEDMEGPAGVPVTLQGGDDVGGAVPDRWTFTRISPGPVELLESDEATATFSFTFTVAETTTFRITAEGPHGCGNSVTFTRTVTSPSPSPSPDRACRFTLDYAQPTTAITAGEAYRLGATLDNGDTRSTRWVVERLSPGPAAVVRDQTNSSGHDATLRFTEHHVLRHRYEAGDGSCGGTLRTVDVKVRHALTIDAVRNAPRDYTFTGRVLPARGQTVAVHRHTEVGLRVLTGRAVVQPDGTYRFDRRFSGSGVFGFSVATGATDRNLAGESRVRRTVLH
jgi:hypothetical protein